MSKSLNSAENAKSLFGSRLRERRVFLKLSQESLGVAIGLDESCSKTRISRYESGLHEPKISTAQLLASSLKAPLIYFYCERDVVATLCIKIDLMTDDQIQLLSDFANLILNNSKQILPTGRQALSDPLPPSE